MRASSRPDLLEKASAPQKFLKTSGTLFTCHLIASD
jgi:hypothetical protein